MDQLLKIITFILAIFPLLNLDANTILANQDNLPTSIVNTLEPESMMSNKLSDKPSISENKFSENTVNMTEGNPLSLTLKDTIIRTLDNNISIAVEEFNSKVKKENVIESQSEFDATFEVDLSIEETIRQQASAFSSPNKSRNYNHIWDFSLTQKLGTGADYELSFTNKRNKSNSVTLGLNPNYSTGLEFIITQPLLKNFGTDLNKRNIYIANNEVNISNYEFKGKVIEVISNVENLYWDLVFSLKNLKVKEKSLERAKDLERRVKAQVLVGTMAEIEILQAKSEVASREESLLVAQDVIKDDEDNLKNILNINFSSPEGFSSIYPSDEPNMVIEEVDLDVAIKEALSNRPDYLLKKKELENQNIIVKYQENQIYPSIDLVGSLGVNGLSGNAIEVTSGTFTGKSSFGGDYGEALSHALSADYLDWELGVKLSYPLGNRSAKSKLSASRLEAAKLILNIKELEREIIVEVREAARQLKTDIKRVAASRIAKKLAEEKLKGEEKKFQVGLSTSFNILEFQEDLTKEQSNEIKAIIDYNQSKIRLHQVMASTLTFYNIKLQDKESL